MDQLLIVVALLIVSGISSWLKKRAQNEEETHTEGTPPFGGPESPPPVRRPQQRPPTDWEEELRRMLDMPSPEPPPPVVPPPPLVVAPPPPVVRVNRTLRPIPRIIPEALPVEQPQSGALAHAADSVRAARHLQETVLERIHKAGELRGAVTHSSPVFVPKRGVSALRKDFRSRDDLRRAFVASLVFGPPKALDDGSEVRA